jgi:hypothetical protein
MNGSLNPAGEFKHDSICVASPKLCFPRHGCGICPDGTLDKGRSGRSWATGCPIERHKPAPGTTAALHVLLARDFNQFQHPKLLVGDIRQFGPTSTAQLCRNAYFSTLCSLDPSIGLGFVGLDSVPKPRAGGFCISWIRFVRAMDQINRWRSRGVIRIVGRRAARGRGFNLFRGQQS